MAIIGNISYRVPGCPEEPDTETEVRVYRQVGLKDTKARTLFYCMGGAIIVREPGMFPIERQCYTYNCVAIVTMYRRSWEAQYPAAINDLHAAYKWMTDNAQMLQIDADNVVITGGSSGGHLGLSLAFSLKRYGYRPKGVVAVIPQTDERFKDYCVYNGASDTVTNRNMLFQYLGNNYGSGLVGPEALANHASVEDCKGYPPTFIHSAEFDLDCDYNREFYSKVLHARSYAEYHCWGGASHNPNPFGRYMGNVGGGESEYSKRADAIIEGNIEDCFKYDLRRPWLAEEDI